MTTHRLRVGQRPGEVESPDQNRTASSTLVRLHKIIADAGLASRREAEQWILDGRVTVNGRVIDRLGSSADAVADHIRVDGRPLSRPAARAYFAFHKPAGVVSTMKDERERPAVVDFLTAPQRRLGVFPVGRLDYNSSGLMLLTNDGALAHRLMHPRFRVKKVYRVKLSGLPPERQLDRLRRGILLSDGPAGAVEVRVLRRLKQKAWLEVGIREGRYREIRRMMEAIGQRVERLVRCRIGPLALDALAMGQSRPLSAAEVSDLKGLLALREHERTRVRTKPGGRDAEPRSASRVN